jgi:RimJ/RimL family protein N-acetyltransferase
MCAIEVVPAIGTERLVLRRPELADAAVLAELANDLGVSGMLSTMPYPYRLADAEAFLGKASRCDFRDQASFAITHRQFGLIGGLGFDLKDGRREVGYWLGRPFWGRGYAGEALDAALRWFRQDWRRKVVWACHFTDNRASAGVLNKAGFLYTGEVERRPCLARGTEVPARMMVWLA